MKKMNGIFIAAVASIFLTACMKEYNNPSVGTVNNLAEIYVVRQAYQGSPLTLDAGKMGGSTQTAGTVISDKASGNIEAGSFVIQSTASTSNTAGDLTAGIVIEMGGDVPFVPGDSVVVNLEGATLQRKAGRLVVSGISAGKVNKVASGRTVEAQPVTLGLLETNFGAYESTLVSVHADVVNHNASLSFKGERSLNDGTGTMILYTRDASTFSSALMPIDAQFTGIAGYKNDSGNDTTGAKKVISLRNSNDVNYVSGALYPGFPESFEAPDAAQKASYNITATSNNIDLATGNWKLQQAILGNTILSDKIILPGKQNIRMQQNLTTSALVQMNFDVTQGASKVTVFYGKYSTDPTSTFRLEYSTNGGTTWTNVSPNISDMPERGYKQATFMLNITGNARFRINKLGLGASSATVFNGRLNIDQFSIYKK